MMENIKENEPTKSQLMQEACKDAGVQYVDLPLADEISDSRKEKLKNIYRSAIQDSALKVATAITNNFCNNIKDEAEKEFIKGLGVNIKVDVKIFDTAEEQEDFELNDTYDWGNNATATV